VARVRVHDQATVGDTAECSNSDAAWSKVSGPLARATTGGSRNRSPSSITPLCGAKKPASSYSGQSVSGQRSRTTPSPAS